MKRSSDLTRGKLPARSRGSRKQAVPAAFSAMALAPLQALAGTIRDNHKLPKACASWMERIKCKTAGIIALTVFLSAPGTIWGNHIWPKAAFHGWRYQ